MPHHSQDKVVRFVGEKRFTGSAGTYKKVLQMEEPRPRGKEKLSHNFALASLLAFSGKSPFHRCFLNCFLTAQEGRMADSRIMETLRAAVSVEQHEELERTRRYQAFMRKMASFQTGAGPAPEPEEFQQWCEDVEHRLALRRLEAGIPEWSPDVRDDSRY
jgi:hypothetical protein